MACGADRLSRDFDQRGSSPRRTTKQPRSERVTPVRDSQQGRRYTRAKVKSGINEVFSPGFAVHGRAGEASLQVSANSPAERRVPPGGSLFRGAALEVPADS